MAETFRAIVARALHDYYCVGEGQVAGEPCLGRDEDIEGWTPVAEGIIAGLRANGYAIHAVDGCVRVPPPSGRPMTEAEQIAVGLRQYTAPVTESRDDGFVFGDLP